MAVNNNKIFERVFDECMKYGLSFVSSNGGTGKTVYFNFRFLRDAVEKNMPFHIFVRYGNEMEQMAHRFLQPKESYSKRQIDLLDRCEVLKETDKFIYIIDKLTNRKVAQIVNVFGQAYYKKFGNTIGAKRALFDEILAENGEYCPDELNKFNRLVFTMARNDEYHVVGLYNNSSPNFDYFTYYGGKSYNTHVSGSGALFIYFTARQFSHNEISKDPKSIQAIIQNTAYNDVYNHNTFIQFPVYYTSCNLINSRIHFKIEIENRVFKVREKDGVLFLDDTKASKKSSKPIYTINDSSRSKLKQLPDTIRYNLALYKDNAILKTNNINNTIFVKILCSKI